MESDRVWTAVGTAVGTGVGTAVWTGVWTAVWTAVGGAIRTTGNAVTESGRDGTGAREGSRARSALPSSAGGSFDSAGAKASASPAASTVPGASKSLARPGRILRTSPSVGSTSSPRSIGRRRVPGSGSIPSVRRVSGLDSVDSTTMSGGRTSAPPTAIPGCRTSSPSGPADMAPRTISANTPARISASRAAGSFPSTVGSAGGNRMASSPDEPMDVMVSCRQGPTEACRRCRRRVAPPVHRSWPRHPERPHSGRPSSGS